MASPSASALASGFKMTMPTPSPRTYPLADSSKALQYWSGFRKPPLDNMIDDSGRSIKLTPPAIAISASPVHTLWQAKCRAVNEAEQAVSKLTLGPVKSNS
nr:hypothetical protein [Roseimaritima ulvae]